MALPHILFGTLREHYVLLFGAAGGIGLIAGMVGAWIGARYGARSAIRRSLMDASQELVGRPELRAMSDSLDALLLEVERLAEGQRFVAKVLAERGERAAIAPASPPVRRDPGQITPH